MARVLTNTEIAAVAGGMVPVDRGDDGSTGGSSTGTTTSYLMGSSTIDRLATNTGLKSQLAHAGFDAKFGTAPRVAYGSSGTDYAGHVADIAPKYSDNPDAAVMQLAHEVGHILHQQDQNPTHYYSQSAYINAQMKGEGWAQLTAIKTSQVMADQGHSCSIPGDAAHAAREVQTYVTMHANGYSDDQIAQQIGSDMLDQSLGNNLTYSQFWGSYYNDNMYGFEGYQIEAPSGQGFWDPDWRYRS